MAVSDVTATRTPTTTTIVELGRRERTSLHIPCRPFLLLRLLLLPAAIFLFFITKRLISLSVSPMHQIEAN